MRWTQVRVARIQNYAALLSKMQRGCAVTDRFGERENCAKDPALKRLESVSRTATSSGQWLINPCHVAVVCRTDFINHSTPVIMLFMPDVHPSPREAHSFSTRHSAP